MTVQEFLQEFLAALGPLSEEERQQITDYYQEFVCEGLERGLREEEILALFGSPAEAAARFREENGSEQTELPAVATQTESEISVLDLQAENAWIEVTAVEQGKLQVIFDPRPEIDLVESRREGDVWRFRHSLQKRISHFLTGLFWRNDSARIQVLVPESFAGTLLIRTCDAKIHLDGVQNLREMSLTTSNASIEAENASVSLLRIKTGNANIRLLNLGVNDLEAVTSNARIGAEAIRSGKLYFKTSNGSIHMKELEGASLTAVTSNARIQAAQCSVTAQTSLTTSNGAVLIDSLACPDITLRTSNGSITGTVRGEMREYATEAGTSNASCNVPNLHSPDQSKHFSAHTSNGRIAVEFLPENRGNAR